MAEPPSLPLKLVRVEFRTAETDLRAWRELAVKEKQTLSDWIRRACDERVAKEQKKRER